MTILLTGAAGFIGMHVGKALLERGETVVGVDNLNSYYTPELKDARLAELQKFDNFAFQKIDFSEPDPMLDLLGQYPDMDRIVHLGAQAGVRYSIEKPYDYARSNLLGHLTLMEVARGMMDRDAGCQNFVYASSSSVYGANKDIPFSVDQKTDRPVSFYAATKKSSELMAYSYASLYGIPSVGLRFFTVYGPWGRPDMSPWLFTDNIISGKPIRVFNNGDMRRDFTFIGDITNGVIAALDRPPAADDSGVRERVYNLGNNKPVNLLDYIGVIERACQKKAILDLQPMQPGDVYETYADISLSEKELDYSPTTSLEDGVPQFVDWFKDYHGV